MVIHRSTGPYWSELHNVIAEHARVIAVDLPGYGDSELPEFARSPRDLGILMLRFLETVGLHDVNVLGMGLGGWVAAEMCTMHQASVRSLFLIGAAGIRPKDGFIHDPMSGSWEDYVRFGLSTAGAFDRLFGDVDADLLRLWDYSRDMTARVTWKPWMWSEQLAPLLNGVATKTVVIWGANDRVIPIECGVQYSERFVNSDFFVIEEAGHLVELERPEVVAELVSSAIRTNRN
jgi:pimeloyl-ACP methyl ester carboxylesterase